LWAHYSQNLIERNPLSTKLLTEFDLCFAKALLRLVLPDVVLEQIDFPTDDNPEFKKANLMKFLLFLLRLSGLWICALALLGLVLDGVRSIAANEIVIKSLGESWFDFDNASLNLAQAAIQRNLHPLIWDPTIQTILTMPAWLVGGIVGLFLIYLGRKRRPRVVTV
jgi:hypothetical protein